MKVLHLATMDYGGAARGMLNLHKALLSLGIESKILVAEKTLPDDTIYRMEPNYQLFKWSKFKPVAKVQKILRKRGKCQTVVEKWNSQIQKVASNMGTDSYLISSPYTVYDVTQHPLVKQADLIHLHWVGNFIDYQSFFHGINKPVIWTLRDENPGLGGFHYRSDKLKYERYYGDIDASFLNTKKEALINVENLTLIALSNIMEDFCKEVDFLSNKRLYKIYNPIDDRLFYSIDKKTARLALGLDENAFIVSFVSVSLRDQRKGLPLLLDSIRLMKKPVKLLCMGINDYFPEIPDGVICYGNVESGELQSIIYSASDCFISLSNQESFGKTVAEALLCGVPVISTKVGVAPEVIDDHCGCLIENPSPTVVAKAIDDLSDKTFERDLIRRKAVGLFNPLNVAREYMNVYSEAIAGE